VVGVTSAVVVVRVDGAGVSTNVQLVRKPRALRLMRLMMLVFMAVFMVVSILLVGCLISLTDEECVTVPEMTMG